MAKKQKTPQEKATILAVLDSNGGNAKHTARELEIPETTVRHYKHGERGANDPEVLALVKEAKEQIREKGWPLAKKVLERLEATLENCTDPVKLGTTFAIIVDKMSLMDGAPTTRIETGSPTDYQAKLDAAREERRMKLVKANG